MIDDQSAHDADLEKAFSIIAANPDHAEFTGEQSLQSIREAERLLGLMFPPSYRAFLLRLGCGDFAGSEFYGICHPNFSASAGAPDVVRVTQAHRSTGTPHGDVVIYGVGDGTYYAIDTSHVNSAGECPVVESHAISHPSAPRRLVYPDFAVCLRTIVEEAIADELES